MNCQLPVLSLVKEAARAGMLVSAGTRGIEFILPPGHDGELLGRLQTCLVQLGACEPDAHFEGEVPISSESLPVSDAQRRQLLAFLEGSRADPHVTYSLRVVQSSLAPEAAAKAASELEARHQVFQYDIEEENGVFRQVKRRLPGVEVRIVNLWQMPDEAAPQAFHAALSWLVTEAETLGQRPHCRISIVAPDQNLLIFAISIDHIFSDLLSVRLALSDFVALYRSHLGHPVALPKVEVSYQEHTFRSLEAGRKHLKFWSLYLAGASQPEFKRHEFERRASHETQVLRFSVGMDSYSRMKELAKQARCTMFAVALARVFAFLQKMTAQSDLTIGIVSANRTLHNRSVVALIADTIFVRAQYGERLDAAYVSYVAASLQAAVQHAQTSRTHVTAVTGISVPTVVVNFMSIPPISQNSAKAAHVTPLDASAMRQTISEIFQEDKKTMPQLLYIELADTGQDIRADIYYNAQYFNQAACEEMCRIFSHPE